MFPSTPARSDRHVTPSSYAELGALHPSLLCPITGTRLRDPVVAPDGTTFERGAIVDWVRRHGTLPTDGTPVPRNYPWPPNIALGLRLSAAGYAPPRPARGASRAHLGAAVGSSIPARPRNGHEGPPPPMPAAPTSLLRIGDPIAPADTGAIGARAGHLGELSRWPHGLGYGYCNGSTPYRPAAATRPPERELDADLNTCSPAPSLAARRAPRELDGRERRDSRLARPVEAPRIGAADRGVVVTLKMLTGKTFSLPVRLSSTVWEFKGDIRDHMGAPEEQMSLVYRLEVLEDEFKLAEYIEDDDVTVHLLFRGLRGD